MHRATLRPSALGTGPCPPAWDDWDRPFSVRGTSTRARREIHPWRLGEWETEGTPMAVDCTKWCSISASRCTAKAVESIVINSAGSTHDRRAPAGRRQDHLMSLGHSHHQRNKLQCRGGRCPVRRTVTKLSFPHQRVAHQALGKKQCWRPTACLQHEGTVKRRSNRHG